VWIAGQGIRAATAPSETPVEVMVPVAPREPAPTVIFSAPVPDDTDVDRAATVRIQFSRDMMARSFRDTVRVSYATPPAQGQPALAPPAFVATYNDGMRALEVRFKTPLERFQQVKVELLEGITAVDRQPLAPWSLTFLTGS
jgi:hypothetical protein